MAVMALTKSALFFFLIQLSRSADVYGKDKVKLKDVTTLTLYNGRWTTGRRTQPVPQLQCIAGSAGCSSDILPSTVQCYNRGHDGSDIQWDCKADLMEGTKFGQLDVLCEGYDYPDDPYILKGSCGLEYRLEIKGKGSSGSGYSSHSQSTKADYKDRGGFGDLMIIAIALIICYALYKTCLANNQRSPTEGDYPGGGGTPYPQGYQGGFASAPPPPPSYTYPDYGDSCRGDRNFYSGSNRRSGGGTFWTGAATGGILGYLLGSRGASSGTRHSTPTSHSSGSASSSSYSASGFGGTRRR